MQPLAKIVDRMGVIVVRLISIYTDEGDNQEQTEIYQLPVPL